MIERLGNCHYLVTLRDGTQRTVHSRRYAEDLLTAPKMRQLIDEEPPKETRAERWARKVDENDRKRWKELKEEIDLSPEVLDRAFICRVRAETGSSLVMLESSCCVQPEWQLHGVLSQPEIELQITSDGRVFRYGGTEPMCTIPRESVHDARYRLQNTGLGFVTIPEVPL